MSVLVTGAAGFIGSNYCRHRYKTFSNEQIVALDSLTYAGTKTAFRSCSLCLGFFIKGSICDQGLVTSILREFDIDLCVHFAAESHVDRSILGPRCIY